MCRRSKGKIDVTSPTVRVHLVDVYNFGDKINNRFTRKIYHVTHEIRTNGSYRNILANRVYNYSNTQPRMHSVRRTFLIRALISPAGAPLHQSFSIERAFGIALTVTRIDSPFFNQTSPISHLSRLLSVGANYVGANSRPLEAHGDSTNVSRSRAQRPFRAATKLGMH